MKHHRVLLFESKGQLSIREGWPHPKTTEAEELHIAGTRLTIDPTTSLYTGVTMTETLALNAKSWSRLHVLSHLRAPLVLHPCHVWFILYPKFKLLEIRPVVPVSNL